jgi:phosphatidylserine/phosphatidylglycerophosphate/cardiolipin synthase-like enzyme
MNLARLLLLWPLLAAGGCAFLPVDVERKPSAALHETGDTRIGRMVAPLALAHPGDSGAYPLLQAREAFAARWALAGSAERSLDVQYYIWHADVSGSLMAHALREAAARGVRVRVLLDDANTSGLDADIAALGAYPNIEVRLFNPFANRSSYNLDPRSARLNTGMGVLMDSPELASRVADAFGNDIAWDAYEVRLGADGKVVWVEQTAGGEVRHPATPGAGALRGWWVDVLRLLPIEWLL